MNLKYGSYGYDFEVSELKEEQYKEWDSFVDESPQGTIFHKTSWLKSYDNYRYRIVAFTHKKSIVAGIPLTYTRHLGAKFAINPPYTSYLGVIFKESNQKYNTRLSFERELSKIVAMRLKNFASYIRYHFHYSFLDATPFMWTGFSVRPYYGYVLNLEEHQNVLLENMEKDTRNRIKRASIYDFDFADATPAEMANLICLSFERKNQRPRYSKQEYEKFLNTFSKNVPIKSIIMKNKDEPVAGGSIVYDIKRAYYLFAGINPDRAYKGANQLVLWMLIRHAKEVVGLKEFDLQFGPNEGLERFLRGFGGKLTQGIYIYKRNISYYPIAVALKITRKHRY